MNGQGALFDGSPSGRYQPAQLWYDSTDQRLVVLVNGKEVPVTEPVLPGLEVVPPAQVHVGWNDPVTPANQAHVASCPICLARFQGFEVDGKPGRFVGKSQAGPPPGQAKNP